MSPFGKSNSSGFPVWVHEFHTMGFLQDFQFQLWIFFLGQNSKSTQKTIRYIQKNHTTIVIVYTVCLVCKLYSWYCLSQLLRISAVGFAALYRTFPSWNQRKHHKRRQKNVKAGGWGRAPWNTVSLVRYCCLAHEPL